MSYNTKYLIEKVGHYMTEPHPNGIDVGNTYEGVLSGELKVGECALFHLTKEPPSRGRFLITTPVIEITSDGFKTKNSRYKLTIIND